MKIQVLKDREGIKVGEVRDDGSKQTLHDHTGRKLGEYRPITNSTHDSKGKKVGLGNLLNFLLLR